MTTITKIRIAEEQLKRVKRGELPTKLGKKLIGELNELKYLADIKNKSLYSQPIQD